jgi:hypothetical protein
MSRILPAAAACLCLAIGLPAVALAQPPSRGHHATAAKKKKHPKKTSGHRGRKGDRGASGAKGDMGLAGVKGDAGLAGSNGANGTNGANGATVVTVHSNFFTVGAGGSTYVTAVCPAGQVATGGGGWWNDGGQLLSRSFPSTAAAPLPPSDGQTPIAWTVYGVNSGSGMATLGAYVVCAAP